MMSPFQQQPCQLPEHKQINGHLQFYNQQIHHLQNLQEQTDVPAITIHQVDSATSLEQNNDPKHQDFLINNIEKAQNDQNQQNQQNENLPVIKKYDQENINEQNESITNFNEDLQFPQFQVVIHKVNSKQSLQSDTGRFQIQFSKSQLEIPLNDTNKQNTAIKQNNYVNIWKKEEFQEDDIYVKILEQKWAKKQSQASLNENYQTQEKDKGQQKFDILNILTQLSKPNNENKQIAKKEQPTKKTFFKIKKVKDDHSKSIHSSLNVTSTLISPKQTNRMSTNKSQFLNTKKQKSLLPLNKYSKNKILNSENASSSPKKSNQKEKKIEENIRYEFALGKIQRMNQILQERSYNPILSPIIKSRQNKLQEQQKLQQIKNSQPPVKIVRKVIKRSPYGFLQLEVKDLKNNAKITNLRILKPKQMIKLKKIPKNIKNFKQNVCQ